MSTNNDSIENLRGQHAATSGRDKPAPDTIETLRRDIDRGATGEKVNHPDPAAAPLGADDEAGGASPNRQGLSPADAGMSAAARGVAPAPVPGVDHSAGESGDPADMDYYRTDAKGGSMLAMKAVAVPIVLVLLIIFGAIWYWL